MCSISGARGSFKWSARAIYLLEASIRLAFGEGQSLHLFINTVLVLLDKFSKRRLLCNNNEAIIINNAECTLEGITLFRYFAVYVTLLFLSLQYLTVIALICIIRTLSNNQIMMLFMF